MARWGAEYTAPIIENNQKGTLAEPSKHKTFNTIFYGFSEITDTFEALKLSEVLISLAPPKSKKISNDKYIKYLVSTYLQDVYILKERLNSYATKLKRLYAKAGCDETIYTYIEPIFSFVKDSLDNSVKRRGVHVHANRYSDGDLDNVAQMALISNYDDKFIRV